MSTMTGSGVSCVVAFALLSGCASTLPDPQSAVVAAAPDRPAMKTVTNFTQSLRCMDDLMLAYGKRDIRITSEFKDQTGEVTAGIRGMMVSSFSRMTTKSNAFKYIDFNVGDQNINQLSTSAAVPQYYVSGGVTQIDRGVMVDNQGIGGAIPEFSFGVAQDQFVSTMAVDMHIAKVSDRTILPGVQSSNTITIVRSGNGIDVEGLIPTASGYIEVSQDRSDGTHQSVRTLIELGLVELLGKFTRVPYWRCLGLEATDPTIRGQAMDWFEDTDQPTLFELTRSGLETLGYDPGPDSSSSSAQFMSAVQRYKVENDLIATREVDFDLYYSLLINGAISGGSDVSFSRSEYASFRPDFGPASSLSVVPSGGIDLKLSSSKPEYRVGENVQASVRVSEDAYIYCFMSVPGKGIARIFPNRFDRRNFVKGGETVYVPGRGGDFAIKTESAREEQIICSAQASAYGVSKPIPVEYQDLEWQENPTWWLIDQIQEHQDFDGDIQTVTIKVR
ncbi:MAG: DUF4384 domain-containing protein [Pseudomonadota bacterium]